MPQVLSQGNCQYTPISTAGTYTLNPGPVQGPPSQPGVFFGMQAVGSGTTWAFTAFDVVPASPGGAAASTNTLLNGTTTAQGQQFPAGVTGVGVRYRGALVLVVTGTPGAFNALWD